MLTPTSVKPSGNLTPSSAIYSIGARNRWSRLSLAFEELTPDRWHEFAAILRADPAEAAGDVADFAAFGVEFRAGDGSSLDFAQVPGLAQTATDVNGAWLAAPRDGQDAQLRLCFLVPAPARQIIVSLRSWRNTHVVQLGNPVLREAGARLPAVQAGFPPLVLGEEPIRFGYGLVPGRSLVLAGQLVRLAPTEGAQMRIGFRDAAGDPILPPYPGIPSAPGFPAFIDLPAHRDASRFRVEIPSPPGAAFLDAGFATWDGAPALALAGEPEASLGSDLHLETLAEEEGSSAEAVVGRLLARIDPAAGSGAFPRFRCDPDASPRGLAPLRASDLLREGAGVATLTEDGLRIGPWPAWPLTDSPDWGADPYRAPAWRLAFQSLAWLPGSLGGGDAAARARAVAFAVSWSRANPWGRPADPLSLHPSCLARRGENLLRGLADAGEAGAGPDSDLLSAEVVQHGLALAAILAQNTVAGTVLEIEAAASLLGIGRACPTFALARYWTELAGAALKRSFEQQFRVDEGSSGPACGRRLELVTLAVTLIPVLRQLDGPAAALADLVESGLRPAWRRLQLLLEPDGSLPPFGDAPPPEAMRGWMTRLSGALVRARGEESPVEPDLRLSDVEDALIARREGADWASFTCGYAARLHPQDHRDCTSFTYASGGVRWITEAGGSATRQSRPFGRYLAAARAHNVVIPDGREPTAGAGILRETARIGPAKVHVVETTVHGPDFRHARSFVLLDDLSGLAVFDAFSTEDRPLILEGFLHFDAEIAVALTDPCRAFALQGGRRLSIVARMIAGRFGGLGAVTGWEGSAPAIQGFVAQNEEAMRPAPVLRYGMAGRGSVCGGLLIAANATSLDALGRIVGDDRFVALAAA